MVDTQKISIKADYYKKIIKSSAKKRKRKEFKNREQLTMVIVTSYLAKAYPPHVQIWLAT